MFNILTIDIEDYFQVHAFSKVIRYEDWDKFECRIERNTDRLLEILNSVPDPQHSALNPQSSVHEVNSLTHSPINSEFGGSVPNPQPSPCAMRPALCESPKGTFFILGWIAERYPDLVRRIQKEGHEIACHGYAHRLVYAQSRDEFRQDIKRAKSILEDITGSQVFGYRAPSYSITNESKWAFEVLVEEGFRYDSSIFPIHHDFYGLPQAPRFPFVVSLNENHNFEFSMLNFESNAFRNSKLLTQNSTFSIQNLKLNIQGSRFIVEFPLSTAQLLGTNIPISGGGYFRLFPYPFIKKGLKRINQKENRPFIFYIHPWELDPGQRRINGLSSRSNFRHYVNLDKTESRFRKLLRDFEFSTIRQFLTQNS